MDHENIKILLLFFFILGLEKASKADVLFIDFNGNNSSIATAKETLKNMAKPGETPEKLVVFPDKKIKPENLEAEFESFISHLEQQPGLHINTLLFSGHDAGGNFGGVHGSMRKDSIDQVMQRHSLFKNEIQSIILRGCYTATLGEVVLPDKNTPTDLKGMNTEAHELKYWKLIFPQCKYISGYTDPAESSQKPLSMRFVSQSLAFRDKFLAAQNAKDVEDLFQKMTNISSLNNSGRLLNVGVWAHGLCPSGEGFYEDFDIAKEKKGALPVEDARKNCLREQGELKKNLDIAKKYFDGIDKGFESIPSDPHNSPLRDAYTYIRKHSHCISIFMGSAEESADPDMIERLVFFKNLLSNFKDNYPIAPIQALLNKYDSSHSIEIPPIDRLNRSQVATLDHQLRGLVQNLQTQAQELKDHGQAQKAAAMAHDIEALDRFSDRFDAGLYRMSRYNVPMDWITSAHCHCLLE